MYKKVQMKIFPQGSECGRCAAMFRGVNPGRSPPERCEGNFSIEKFGLIAIPIKEPLKRSYLLTKQGVVYTKGKKNNAEVDYVIQVDDAIVPVEVKSGKTGSLKSLHQFIHLKKTSLALRFDLNPPSLSTVEHKLTSEGGTTVRFHLLSLPLYLVEQAPAIIRQIRNGLI